MQKAVSVTGGAVLQKSQLVAFVACIIFGNNLSKCVHVSCVIE